MKVFIDVGHGQDNRLVGLHDPGNTWCGQKESRIVLKYAGALETECLRRNWTVKLSRRNEQTPCPLNARVGWAKQFDADVIVSLHTNASDKGEAPNGTEVYYSAYRQLADDMSKAISAALNVRNRGPVFNGEFAILRADRPSVLVELAYQRNPSDLKRLLDPLSPAKVAAAICDVLSIHIKANHG